MMVLTLLLFILSLAGGQVTHYIPKLLHGNQLPPPGSGYAAHYNDCGKPNVCDGNGGPGCNGRKRRSILRPPAGRNRTMWARSQGDDYVRGGDDVPEYTYPWVGRFAERSLPAGRVTCTAILISSRHALTAKHCFNKSYGYGKSYDFREKSNYRLTFGRKSSTDPSPVKVNIIKLHVPEKHNKNSDSDIMLIEFDEIKFSDYVRPICLPVHGIPQAPPATLTFLGYGATNYVKSRESVSKEYKPKLQQIDVGCCLIDLKNPGEEITSDHQKFEAWHATDNPVTVHMTAVIPRGRATCAGDSGGPWMWRNEDTNRFTLIGVASHTGTDACFDKGPQIPQTAIATKVSSFMDFIVKKMFREDALQYCLHDECKIDAPPTPISRTWMVQTLNRDGSIKKTNLAPPCAYSAMRRKYVCPVDLQNGRTRINTESQKLRVCGKCGKNEAADWTWTHYLDEITAGSFSQPDYTAPYTASESPWSKFSSLIDKPSFERATFQKYYHSCHIRKDVSTNIYCPQQDNEQCIFPENVCDGYQDCEDGWDESPHLCTGKCDFWKQYQYPSFAYSKPTAASGYFNKNNVKSAVKCHDECVKNDICTHWNWYGKGKNQQSKASCLLLIGETKKFHDFNDDEIKIDVLSKKYRIRGPKFCPHDTGTELDLSSDFGWYNIRTCKPTNGIPYRAGIYLIQAYNGMFLVNEAPNVDMGPFKLEVMANKGQNNNGNLNTNKGEWIFNFYGDKDDLFNSYFTLQSGYDGGVKNGKPLFLTLKNRAVKLEELAKASNVQTNVPGWPHGFDFDFSTNGQKQYWFMEPARSYRGYTEVFIYTKIGSTNTKHYLTVSKEAFKTFPEYHYKLNNEKKPKDSRHKFDNEKYTIEQAVGITNEEEKIRQTFRILECDYGLQDGSTKRGVTRQDLRAFSSAAGKQELHGLLQDVVGNPLEEAGEKVLRNIFGINHERLSQKLFLEKAEAVDQLFNQIVETMAVSETIYDYAGRMRITPDDFRNMHATWDLFAKNDIAQKIWYGETVFDWVRTRTSAPGAGFLRSLLSP